jgi:DNA-binding NtrC family response regulator
MEPEQNEEVSTVSLAVVLLVDDEVPFVETMTKRLTKRNLTVLSAFSGKDCLEKLSEHAGIDVVILDVNMPDMDGFTTLKKIKQSYPSVEVIMLTGQATLETAIQGIKMGAFDYLMKPCDIEVLVAKINEARLKKTRDEDRIREARLKEITLRRI